MTFLASLDAVNRTLRAFMRHAGHTGTAGPAQTNLWLTNVEFRLWIFGHYETRGIVARGTGLCL